MDEDQLDFLSGFSKPVKNNFKLDNLRKLNSTSLSAATSEQGEFCGYSKQSKKSDVEFVRSHPEELPNILLGMEAQQLATVQAIQNSSLGADELKTQNSCQVT